MFFRLPALAARGWVSCGGRRGVQTQQRPRPRNKKGPPRNKKGGSPKATPERAPKAPMSVLEAAEKALKNVHLQTKLSGGKLDKLAVLDKERLLAIIAQEKEAKAALEGGVPTTTAADADAPAVYHSPFRAPMSRSEAGLFDDNSTRDSGLTAAGLKKFSRASAETSPSMLGNKDADDSEDLDLHAARQLSKVEVSESQRLRWTRMVDKNPNMAVFKIPPPRTNRPLEYESLGLQAIHATSFDARILLEVRNAIVPASSHHPSFSRLAKHRKHLILYTHADVLDEASIERLRRWTLTSWPASDVRFLDSRPERSDFRPYETTHAWLCRHLDAKSGNLNAALTVGVPNVGKSSCLLALLRGFGARVRARDHTVPGEMRNGKKAAKNTKQMKRHKPAVLNKPGHTREMTQYILREKPRLYCLDVPGITPPHFFFDDRPHYFYALTAAGCMPEAATDDQENVTFDAARYALKALNRERNFAYVPKLDLEAPTDDIAVACQLFRRADKRPPLAAAELFLKFLRTGQFGPVILDDISKPYRNFDFKAVPEWKFNRKKTPTYQDDDDFYREEEPEYAGGGSGANGIPDWSPEKGLPKERDNFSW